MYVDYIVVSKPLCGSIGARYEHHGKGKGDAHRHRIWQLSRPCFTSILDYLCHTFTNPRKEVLSIILLQQLSNRPGLLQKPSDT